MESRAIKSGAVLESALAAGLLAGLVDIAVAALINHASPKLILQAIASGLLGLSAYKATWTVALGFVLQILMSIAIAAIYAAAATRIVLLRRRPYSAGLAYGVGVFLVMNMIVVPLSAFGPKPTHITSTWLVLNLAAMLLFGLLVSIPVSRILARAMPLPAAA